MIDLSKYLYKTSFSSEIKIFEPSEEDNFLSKASLENLKQYFPAGIKIDESPDLLYIAMPSFNGGLINKNGDGVTKETAIILAEQFKNKYINLEHDRRIVVGNILGYGFAKHGELASISKDEALAYDGPIDIILSGYIWKVIDEELADLIVESADENSLKKNTVSASWEILYSDYDICVGSEIVSKAKIISDSVEFQIYSGYLKSNGGRGIDPEGQPVYKIIKGDCLPVGLGMVRKPAGLVSGISVLEEDQKQETNTMTQAAIPKVSKEISEIQIPPNYPFHPFHYVEECDCGVVIFKCNCSSVSDKPGDVTKVVKAGCKDCEAKAKLESKSELNFQECLDLSLIPSDAERIEMIETKIKEAVAISLDDPITLPGFKKVDLDFYGQEKAEKLIASLRKIQNISKENKKSVNDITDLTVEQKLAVANLDKQKETNKKIKNNMKYKFSDLNKEVLETLAATDVYEVAVDLNKSMNKFAEDRDAKAKELEAAAAEYEKLKTDSAAVAKELENVKLELAKMEESRAKEKIQSDFNLRMSELNEKFELDADKSKSIAKQIRGLDDETFAAWLEDHKAFLVAKKFVPFGKDGEKPGDKKEDKEPDEDMDDEEEEKEKSKAKAKKECKASLLDEIKSLKIETPQIVQKIEGNKSIKELVAAAFSGIFEDEKAKV